MYEHGPTCPCWDCAEDRERMERYGKLADDLHTDLHECLGHGSGQLAPGVKGGDIITAKQYADFELAWEWRLAKDANNGIKYCVTEQRPGAPGYEYPALGVLVKLSRALGQRLGAAGVWILS